MDKYVTVARRTCYYLKDLLSVRCCSCKPKDEKEKRREGKKGKGERSSTRLSSRSAAPVGLNSLSHSKILREGLLAIGSVSGRIDGTG
jgi:hypothetical protein